MNLVLFVSQREHILHSITNTLHHYDFKSKNIKNPPCWILAVYTGSSILYIMGCQAKKTTT